jgi:hypothetical protein
MCMVAVLVIFFVISILLCIIATVMFVVLTNSRKNIGYKPLEDAMKSEYYDFIFVKKNDNVFKEHGDDICTDK